VVILAGGRGKKMGMLTLNKQKCMLPVGKDKKPILEYVTRQIQKHGLKDIIMLVGYKYEQIKNYFGNGKSLGVNIEYFVDKKLFVGPLNVLRRVYMDGFVCGDILVYHGDILSDVNLEKLIEQHKKRKAVATITVVKERLGGPRLCFDKDMRLQPCKKMGNLFSYTPVGILTINTKVLGETQIEGGGGLIRHALLRLADRGMPILGYLTDKPVLDVNTPSDYEQAKVFADELG